MTSARLVHGLGTVMALQWRRDRGIAVIWAAAAVLLWPGLVPIVGGAMDEAARVQLVRLATATPAVLFLRGASTGIGAAPVTWFSVASFLGVLFALMGSTHAVRHTRAEEESGRAELVRGTAVGHLTVPVATVLSGAMLVGGCALLTVVGSLAIGLTWVQAGLIGLALTGVGLTWHALGLLASQLFASARAASAAAAILAGVAYGIRGYGDAIGTPDPTLTMVEPSWVSWLSPLGWVGLTAPFGVQRGWLVTLFACCVVPVLGVALVLALRRELGAAAIGPRPGPARAHRAVASPVGLALRLHRSALVTWLVVGAALGVMVGLTAPVIADSMADNPVVAELIGRVSGGATHDLAGAFVFAILGIAGLLASAAAMSAIRQLWRGETTTGDLLFALPQHRLGTFAIHYGIGAVSGALSVGAAGLTAALLLLGSGRPDTAATTTMISVALLPVVWCYLALAAVLLGWWPTTLSWLPWLLLFGLMLLGQFAPLSEALEVLAVASPFHWVANPLEADPDWTGSAVMAAFSVMASLLGAWGWLRRDLRSG